MKCNVFIFFLFVSQFSFAQNCDIEPIKHLMQKEQFALVYSLAERLMDCNLSKSDKEFVQFNQAKSSLELFNDEAEFRFMQFLEDYPNGKYNRQAYLSLAKLHFRNQDYEKVIAKLSNINHYDLKPNEVAMYYFRLGYSFFNLKKYNEAKLAFSNIGSIPFTYSELTNYCLSHMAYEDGNYAVALQGLKKLIDTPTLGVISKYYITHIYYFQERYNELLDFAKPLLANSYNVKRDKELKRLIGDAHFNLGNFQESVNYLEEYLLENSESSLNRVEKYQLGLAYFKLNDYQKAANQFEDILINKDSLSQFAAHQLGQCYLLQDKKFLAINAFKYASEINFDFNLKEDAAFNKVKLIFEKQSSFENAIESLEQYLEDYPQSINVDYVKDLLIKAYTYTKDFQTAIDKLSAQVSLSLDQQVIFQKLSYYLAIDHFINKRYDESIIWFDKSMDYPLDNKLISLSSYWKAEAYYLKNDFIKAIDLFESFNRDDGSILLDEYKQAHYSLAYAYYKSNKFRNAISWFRKFIKFSVGNKKKIDAYFRLADSYYMTSDYDKAQKYYKLAQDEGDFDVDYALHQQIICFGLTNQISKKQSALIKLISDYPNSPYNDDAMFSLSNVYMSKDMQEESVNLLTNLIIKHPQSILVRSALLKLGLNFYNENLSDSAIYYFKSVIKQYPNTKESKEALTALKNISVESGNVKPYFEYVATLSNVNIDIAFKDSISYAAAENLYLNQDYEKAILAFENYLEDFDSPIFKLNAHFYKAESINMTRPDLAVNDYMNVLEFSNNIFSERALIRLARIEFKREEYGAAALHYNKLKTIAQENSLIRETKINLFNCYKKIVNNDRLVECAKEIIELDKVDNELLNDAMLIIANDNFENSEFHLAKKDYQLISNQTQSKFGAEAKYQLAYIAFLELDYEKSEKIIFELIENYFSDFFIAKSFILLADIYKEKNNLFQSKATLQSILDNYDGDDFKEICLNKISVIDSINEESLMNSKNDELIIDLLNDIELIELFEEENTFEDE